MIPILWRAQEQEGWVSRASIEYVAKLLGMAYIRVLEVATFYTQFLLKPVGSEAHIIVCGTTPCMLRGAGDLIDVCQHKISHDPLEVSADGTLSWEESECLGACVNAPMVMIGSDTYEDLTVERFESIVETFRSGRGATVTPGTQIFRESSAAEGGRTTLTEEPTAKRTYKAFPPPPAVAPAAPGVAPPPAAPATTTSPTNASKAPAQEPTNKGRGREVDAEGAPGLKGPLNGPKVSQGEAEAGRKAFNTAANANGEPNSAMREGATGAESAAGKVDAGAAPGKDKVSGRSDGASTTDTTPTDQNNAGRTPSGGEDNGVSTTRERNRPDAKDEGDA